MSHVLVTGGCGFIGANLVPALLADGHTVRVLDDLRGGRREYLAGSDVEVIEADLTDRVAVAAALRDVTAVVHLAASGSVVDSVRDPAANFAANVGGTFALLDEVRLAGITRFVLASTGGALIGDSDGPVDENSLPKPLAPYGASKLAAEGYCHAYARAYGMRTVATRFGNVYGPFSGHKRGAVTAFLRAIHDGEPIVIHGDGSATRDYVFVGDICAGLRSAVVTDLPGGTVVHLASGRETSVLELADACRTVAGKPDHPIEFRSPRPGEAERNVANYALAERLLGYTPTVSLVDGLQLTWKWYGEHVFDRS